MQDKVYQYIRGKVPAICPVTCHACSFSLSPCARTMSSSSYMRASKECYTCAGTCTCPLSLSLCLQSGTVQDCSSGTRQVSLRRFVRELLPWPLRQVPAALPYHPGPPVACCLLLILAVSKLSGRACTATSRGCSFFSPSCDYTLDLLGGVPSKTRSNIQGQLRFMMSSCKLQRLQHAPRLQVVGIGSTV